MPRFLVPHKSSVHRIGAIGLFRALLTRSTNLPLPQEDLCSLKNVVRHQFKASRHTTSWRKLSLAFQAGYEALALFSAAAPESPAHVRILDILSRVDPKLKTAPQEPATEKPKPAAPIFHPDREHISVRPRPVVAGRRRIPVLVPINQTPFLRTRKPQSQALSAFLRKRQLVMLRRQWLLEQLENNMNTCLCEDAWDRVVQDMGAERETTEAQSASFATHVQRDIALLKKRMGWQVAQSIERGKLYLRIVAQEKELAAKEKKARMEEKWERYRERRARREEESAAAGQGGEQVEKAA